MPSPIPKPAHLRQRTNKHSTHAHLPSAAESADNTVPDMPSLEDAEGSPVAWHPMVLEWWASVWRSPMASEYLDADMRGGLFQLAVLHQDFWTAASPTARRNTAAEIRLAEVRFGLSPIDRRRLQWEVDKGEQAAERTASRRTRRPTETPATDPRSVLKVS